MISRIDTKIFHRSVITGYEGRVEVFIRERCVEWLCQHVRSVVKNYFRLKCVFHREHPRASRGAQGSQVMLFGLSADRAYPCAFINQVRRAIGKTFATSPVTSCSMWRVHAFIAARFSSANECL